MSGTRGRQPTFDVDDSGDANPKCPSCGSPNLHHGKVEVFECAEDQPGLHVTVDGLQAVVDADMRGNPSSRRHGLVVHFSCEQCPAALRLTIAQHKGSTLVGF